MRSWRRPCHCSTTTGLDEPSATFTVRPVSSVSEPAPIAIITGSRTATASGPMVRLARLVRSATTAPSANASKVAISPIQISPYPSASAACAVRTTSAAGRSCHNPSDTDSRGPRRGRTPASLTAHGLVLSLRYLYCHGMTDPALQALLDKQEIAELLTRYLRSVDRGDVDTLRACYLPGATEDHGGLFAGPAQDYVDSIAAALTHPRSRTSHNLTNLLIDLDGDVATAESYCVTFARIKADGQYYHSFTGARMIDRLERRDGDPDWGIAHRQLVWDWNHDAPEAEHWMRGLLAPDPSVLRMSAKFPANPVYAPR